METETAAIRILLGEGINILALVLAFLAPLGLAISAMGSGRFRNRYANLSRQVLLFPFIFLVVYIFGWIFSFAFTSGPGFTGGFQSAWHAVPWADMLGPGYYQSESGAFRSDSQDFIRFLILTWLCCGLMAAATMERMKFGGLLLLSTLLAGFCVALAVAWGWSENGWMVAVMGYHDPVGLTTIATLAGGFTLGVLRVLGPRIAALDDKGRVHVIDGNSPGALLSGRVIFVLGCIGLALAAVDLAAPVSLDEAAEFVSTNIYGAPTDPAGVTLNIIAALCGGLLIGTILTRADLVNSSVLAIAGLVGTLPAADFFNPLQSLLLAMFLTWASGTARRWLERKFILDDVVGTVALFGFAGFWGLVITGVLLWGIPTSVNPEYVHINPFGNSAAAMILFWILGFIPGYVAARILRYSGGLRLEETTELAGQDLSLMRQAELSASAAYQREMGYLSDRYEERN